MKGLVEAYRALTDVYQGGAWIDEAIRKQGAPLLDNKGAFRLVYGVVEHTYLYDHRLARLTERAPKSPVRLLAKMGMYLLDESALPAHAVVNEIAETAKKVGKGGVVGFLNALLRRYATVGKELMPTDPDELLSVRANLPLDLVRLYVGECGREGAERRLLVSRRTETHVRPAFAFGKERLAETLRERGIAYEETPHGFYLRSVGEIVDLLNEGKATVMSYGSAEVASAVPYAGGEILDLCAAPGGKTVYLAEKYAAPVLACDLHEHRVALIEAYAARMHVANVTAARADGTVLREEWRDRFATVLLDAPCSGLGSLGTNADVALRRTVSEIRALRATQYRLIRNAGEYVRRGGCLVYATCSDLPSEDEDVVRAFLSENAAFSLEKECSVDPEKCGGDAYYYAILRKV